MENTSIFVQPRPKLATVVEGLIDANAIKNIALHLKPGDYLFQNGEDTRYTHYIRRGLIKLFSVNANGDTKTVFLHKAGTLIGFQNLQMRQDSKPSILDAQATATCEVYALDAGQFRDYLVAHGDVAYEMCCYLFDMLANQTRESVNGSIYPILQRFAALLLTIARELNLPQAPAVVPFTNADLSAMLGVHPNSVTNAINSLRKVEAVERQRGCLLITDYRKLMQVAGDLVER